jgi:hypothetical protein
LQSSIAGRQASVCRKGRGVRRTRATRNLSLAIVGSCCLVASGACRSSSIPVQNDSRDRPLSLVDVDSAVFAAVVRHQLDGDDDSYPYRLNRLRYDSRPYGTNSGYPEVFAGVEGTAPTLSFPRASQSESEVRYLIQTRKRILKMNGVPEGAAVSYPQCAGAGVPAPPPPRGRSSARRSSPANVHAGCPKAPEYYLTVGLPLHGQPPGLRDTRDTRGKRVRMRGDVWTVLVNETAVGPTGWRQSQYAWLFERDRSGRLELAHTILIGVVQ